MVQHVVENDFDAAEDCDVAVDFSKPVLGVSLHVDSACRWFDAIDQVEPIPGVGGMRRALSRSAQ